VSGRGLPGPLILIHGVGLDLEMWSAQAAALSPRLNLVRYDMLGHGRSPNPPGPRVLADFVAQLDQLLDHLSIGRLDLVGFSMGGLVAQAFALANPGRVSRLVLMSTVFQRSNQQRRAVLTRVEEVARAGPAANLESALKRWFSPGFTARNPEVIERVRRRVLTNDPEGYLKAYRVFATADQQIGSWLGQIRCPSLILTGELDSGSTPEMARRMGACLTGSQVAVLSAQRHLLPIEAAEIINSLLLDFLADRA